MTISATTARTTDPADQKTTSPAWTTAIDRFSVHMREQGRSPQTIVGYRVNLRRLAIDHPDGPGSVTESAFEGWAENRGRSARTAWYSCRSFYQWAVAIDLVRSSPVGAWRGRVARSPYGYVSTMPRAWRSATDEHLDRLHAKGMRDGSIRVHMSYLTRFAAINPSPWLVEPGDIARWLALHPWKPETQRSALKSLRLFYRHAVQSGRTKISPPNQLDRPIVPRALPRPASEGVIGRALRDADVRTRLMLLLASMAGLRSGEIATVHLGTDLEAEGVLMVHGKGGHERRVPLHPILIEELDREQQRRRIGVHASGFDQRVCHGEHDWLFPNGFDGPVSAGHVSRLVSRALPDGVTAHMLRHRFATQSFRLDKNIRAVQELLGHANIATTERYTRVANNDLRNAVLAVPELHSAIDGDDLGDEWTRVAPLWHGAALPDCPAWCQTHDCVTAAGSPLHARIMMRVGDVVVQLQQAANQEPIVTVRHQGQVLQRCVASSAFLRDLAAGLDGLLRVADLLA